MKKTPRLIRPSVKEHIPPLLALPCPRAGFPNGGGLFFY